MSLTAHSLIDLESRLGAHNYKPLDVVLVRGEGVWVWDTDGKRYLDCLSAYSALNQGHCHPRILAAMVEQAKRLTLTSRAFRNDQLALLYEDLAKLTRSHKILPMNSGAEAVESVIKAVRKWGYEVKGVAARAGRDHRLRQQLPRTHAGHRRLQHGSRRTRRLRPVRARVSRRSVRGLRCISGRDQRKHGRIPGGADPGRSRRHHPAGRLLRPRARAVQRTQRDADPRRDPDRPRAHRKTAGGRARRHRGGRDADRQGALGRLLSGLRSAVELAKCWACSSPASTAARSAAIRSPARSRAWRSRCSSTRA